MVSFFKQALFAGLLVFLLAGCETMSYYGQAVTGQFAIISSRQDIDELMADETTSQALRHKLQLVQDVRQFAATELQLPVADAYSQYVALDRDYVVWNVFAAEEFSVAPNQWCFLLVGCVGYRGYFSKDDAVVKAEALKAEGYDVHVGGVAAYSTLGWFDDPVLSSFINRNDVELAALLIHELAHRKLYIKGDTTFNESFATVVEQQGLTLWLKQQPQQQAAAFAEYLAARQQREAVIALVMAYRHRLELLYQSAMEPALKRQHKRQILDALRNDYQAMKQEHHWPATYDIWIATMNNAKLAAVGSYHVLVEPLQKVLMERNHGDFAAFYADLARLKSLPNDQRQQQVAGWAAAFAE